MCEVTCPVHLLLRSRVEVLGEAYTRGVSYVLRVDTTLSGV